MKYRSLFEALERAKEGPPPQLARVQDNDLPALARALAEETEGVTGSLASRALLWVPEEIVRRGARVLPVLDKEMRALLAPGTPVDLCVLLFCPRVLLRAAQGLPDDPAVAPLYQKVLERGDVGCVGDALATLPEARRAELILPRLNSLHIKQIPPWDLVRAHPTVETLAWLAPRIELWSRERGGTGPSFYAHQLRGVLPPFARAVPEPTAAMLDACSGLLRTALAEVLGEHAPGSVAPFLANDLGHRDADYARAVDKALRALAVREPDAVRSALGPLLKSRSKKAAAAAKAMLEELGGGERKGKGKKQAAGAVSSDPREALEALVRSTPRPAVDALVEREQRHPYREPFSWLEPRPDEAALLVAIMEWARVFLPMQLAIGGEYFDRRWGRGWAWLYRKESGVRELVPWAAAESVPHCKKPEVTRTVLDAFESVFGPGGDAALRAQLKGARPAIRKALEAHFQDVGR